MRGLQLCEPVPTTHRSSDLKMDQKKADQNLAVIKKQDPSAEKILLSAHHVALYILKDSWVNLSISCCMRCFSFLFAVSGRMSRPFLCVRMVLMFYSIVVQSSTSQQLKTSNVPRYHLESKKHQKLDHGPGWHGLRRPRPVNTLNHSVNASHVLVIQITILEEEQWRLADLWRMVL